MFKGYAILNHDEEFNIFAHIYLRVNLLMSGEIEYKQYGIRKTRIQYITYSGITCLVIFSLIPIVTRHSRSQHPVKMSHPSQLYHNYFHEMVEFGMR